jgi:hypothetical protein
MVRAIEVVRSAWWVAAAALFAACERNPAESHEENPQELITTVLLRVWDETDSMHVHTFAWRDLDGPGGRDPIVDMVHFHAEHSPWRVSLEFLNEAKTPPDTITEEIRREAEAHQVFYELAPELGQVLEVERLDTDARGLPLGLEARVRVQATQEHHGWLRIRLLHYGSTAKTTEPGAGETDVDVRFPVHVMP